MHKLEKLYIDLETYSSFYNNEHYIEKFLKTFEEIISYKDPKSIKYLLKYFDDSENNMYLMESMKCSIEQYADNDFIEQILINIDVFFNNSPYWCSYIFNRSLNNENCYKILKNKIHIVSFKTLSRLFDLMQKNFPDQKHKLEILKQNMRKNS